MSVNNVGIHDAKTHFSKLIESVKKGRSITITQRGHPVAVLVPVDDQLQDKKDRLIAIEKIREFKKLQSPMSAKEFERLLKADQK